MAELDYEVSKSTLTPENVPAGTVVLNPKKQNLMRVVEWQGNRPHFQVWEGTDLSLIDSPPTVELRPEDLPGEVYGSPVWLIQDVRALPPQEVESKEEEAPSGSLDSVLRTLEHRLGLAEEQDVSSETAVATNIESVWADEEADTPDETDGQPDLQEDEVTEEEVVEPEAVPINEEEEAELEDLGQSETEDEGGGDIPPYVGPKDSKKAWVYELVRNNGGYITKDEFFNLASRPDGAWPGRDQVYIHNRLIEAVGRLNGEGYEIHEDDELVWIGERPDTVPSVPAEFNLTTNAQPIDAADVLLTLAEIYEFAANLLRTRASGEGTRE